MSLSLNTFAANGVIGESNPVQKTKCNNSMSIINNNTENEGSNAVIRSMPYQKTFRAYKTVSNKHGNATICIEVVATLDAQRDYIISIDSTRTYPSGSYFNFKDWTQTSISATKNNSNGTISVTATGTLLTEYTVEGMKLGEYSDHTLSHTFNAF